MTTVDTTHATGTAHATQAPLDVGPAPRIVGPSDGKSVTLTSIGVRFMIWSEESGGGFSLVEHPIPPRGLAAPLHRHAREDEYSYVLEGRLGAQLGDTVVFANAGDLVFKPRGQWHTFWNAGDSPCRILEIISPGGFEHYFEELGDAIAAVNAATAGEVLAHSDLPARYAIEFRPESIPELCRTHGLKFPGV